MILPTERPRRSFDKRNRPFQRSVSFVLPSFFSEPSSSLRFLPVSPVSRNLSADAFSMQIFSAVKSAVHRPFTKKTIHAKIQPSPGGAPAGHPGYGNEYVNSSFCPSQNSDALPLEKKKGSEKIRTLLLIIFVVFRTFSFRTPITGFRYDVPRLAAILSGKKFPKHLSRILHEHPFRKRPPRRNYG